ncbi:TPA: hypothetical protein ACSP0C_002108 [Aeromonas veronii]
MRVILIFPLILLLASLPGMVSANNIVTNQFNIVATYHGMPQSLPECSISGSNQHLGSHVYPSSWQADKLIKEQESELTINCQKADARISMIDIDSPGRDLAWTHDHKPYLTGTITGIDSLKMKVYVFNERTNSFELAVKDLPTEITVSANQQKKVKLKHALFMAGSSRGDHLTGNVSVSVTLTATISYQ